jgi:Ca2+-binding RTX toxin-like protein
MNTDLAGIVAVDASKANGAVTINGIVSSKDLTLTGSNQVDVLAGGAGIDHITGGNGGDFIFGQGGNDVFVVHNAADSRQLAGNDLTHADTIEDWNTGDVIDIGALAQGAISVFNHGTVANFITADTANYFGANDVAATTDGNTTRVYIDANHDGNFTLNQDVVIQLIGNHLNDLGNAAGYV